MSNEEQIKELHEDAERRVAEAQEERRVMSEQYQAAKQKLREAESDLLKAKAAAEFLGVDLEGDEDAGS